jgi:hypothetical protein
LDEIREKVDVVSHANLARSREEDAPWMGIGISSDCDEGIYTNMMSDEELAEELAEWEAEEIEE